MVSAVTFPKCKPSRLAIRDQTMAIRDEWTVGERHHRARLALLLQSRLFAKTGLQRKVS